MKYLKTFENYNGGEESLRNYARSVHDYSELNGLKVYSDRSERTGYINDENVGYGKLPGSIWVSSSKDGDTGAYVDLDDLYVVSESIVTEATANGPADVKAGDTIRLVNNTHMEGDTVSQTTVREVLPDGRILTDDFGHGVIAKYDDGYDAWCVDEDDERGDNWENPGVEVK
jgi:hypothetical protein